MVWVARVENMASYMVYFDDDRYRARNLEVITADDDEAACARVRADLAANPHHLAAEIWDDNRLVARVDRDGRLKLRRRYPSRP
jgi:hypothetical protein